MADDGLSASELRSQYTRGGTLADSQLTASQLRSRHGIQANAKDFSTKRTEATGVNPVLIGLLTLIVMVTLVSPKADTCVADGSCSFGGRHQGRTRDARDARNGAREQVVGCGSARIAFSFDLNARM